MAIPGAFILARDSTPRIFHTWDSGQPVPNFQGVVRVYFSSGPAHDFRTWEEHGVRHWQSLGSAPATHPRNNPANP